jgi:predicted esterase
VLDVTALVGKLYSAEPKFLTGHSMGAAGAWGIGFRNSGVYAAIAPVAGVMNVNKALLEKSPALPVLLVQGAKDRLATAEMARNAAKVAGKELKAFEYKEFADDDHFSIGASGAQAVFDFFDAHRH